MSLRVIAFSIPSTTQLKLTFNNSVSETISVDNFTISSLNGAVNDLEIIQISIEESVVLIKTRPQVAGNYYLLKLLDTDEIPFISEDGETVPFDGFSRELFFVGIDDVNPIRDRMFENVPDLFEIENTLVKNIISAQAEEFYRAQKTIGEVLSNNYLSVDVVDELRTRSAGATDRLANENAYRISRVSRNPTNTLPKFEKILYTAHNSFERHQSLPSYPISLQQKTVTDEVIDIHSESNSFRGFLLTLKNRNVIKLLAVKHIVNGEEEDCNGEIGTNYQIERFKYAIKSNYYDQDFAFNFSELNDNQILLSEFGNLSRPSKNDTLIVSYLYLDKGRIILEDQVEVSRVEEVEQESIPTNTTSFFLQHAPIVSIDNDPLTLNGVSFLKSENLDETPDEFKHELVFNASKLPSKLGEYSINYQTGEVFLVGSSRIGEGTGYNNYIASYYYRKEFVKDLDYSIYQQNLVASDGRDLANEEAEIFIRYESVFAEGIDYLAKSHIEVMPEFVENRSTQSFRIATKNAPITDVFRIFNQTTGEVYNPLYHTDTEIIFSGNRSPQVKTVSSEEAKFKRIENEELEVIGEFIIPTFQVTITHNLSNNNITFTPGIPAELFSQNSTDYFFREIIDSESTEVLDVNIRFFGSPNSNNLITTASINSTATPPSVGSSVLIGTKGFVINLTKSGILNQNLDSLGCLVNTSLVFSDLDLFQRERYFEPIQINPGLAETSEGGISLAFLEEKDVVFDENLSRLRNVGDYCVDYQHGIIYLAVTSDQEFEIGNVNYFCREIETKNKNILTASNLAKKNNAPDSLEEAFIIYQNVSHTNSTITPLDLEESLTVFDGETFATDSNGNRQLICEVLEDYTAVVPFNIKSINGIYNLGDVTGVDLKSSNPNFRLEDYPADQLLISAQDGGRNLYDVNAVTFEDNVIDFKKKKRKRLAANNTITIQDSHASTFVEAKLVSTDQVIFDQDLNLAKLSGLEIVAVSLGSGQALVSIASGIDLSDLDTDGDFLLDVDGNRFEIIDIDTTLSTLTVTSPAENNVEALTPAIDFDGLTSIVIKPTISIGGGSMIITLPEDADISTGELFEITYLTDLIPEVGTPLAIDYRFGFVFADYAYLADELVVWYEYGDNTLDWSISGALEEGEDYFVTYQYGALREALRTNFGSLTNIPFFKSFGVQTDRELYRDAIKGTLQTFPKGPTIPAYKELIKSFTKIEPEVDELIFGNWILGRDYLEPGRIEYSGVLKFGEGKFQDGLIFNDDVTVSIPAISSISLDEGTLEAWIRPEWSGINNDATLTFNFDHLGIEKLFLKETSEPFNEGWDLIPSNQLVGSLDTTGPGLQIYNYQSDQTSSYGLNVGYYGIYYNQENLDRTITSDFQATMKIGMIGTHFNDLREVISEALEPIVLCEGETEGEQFFIVGQHGPGNIIEGPWPISVSVPPPVYNAGSLLIADGEKTCGFSLNLNELNGFRFEVNPIARDGGISEITGEEIPTYDRLHPVRGCSCTIENTVSELLNFNDLKITVELSEEFDFSTFKSDNNILDNQPSVFILVDMEGIFYQVIGFYNENDELITNSIPDQATKFAIKKFGINNPSLSAMGSEAINDLLPTGILRMFFKSADILTKLNYQASSQIFDFQKRHVLDWQEYHSYGIRRNPAENFLDLTIDQTTIRMFYTDAFYSCNLAFDLSLTSTEIKGILLGVMGSNLLTQLEVLSGSGTLTNRYGLEDIYIGREGRNPPRLPFKVNRQDNPQTSVGMPAQASTGEGIFIWYDELCRSPLSDNSGQWIFQVKSSRSSFFPTDVELVGDSYQNILEQVEQSHQFSGTILTDGEFSSVVRAHRDETLGGCETGVICQSNFRYCGNQLLEEFGWVKIEESDSDLVNTILNGRETQHVRWKKYGDFETNNSFGIYRMGPSANNGNCVEEEDFQGNFVTIENPCSGGDYEYLISAKVIQTDPSLIGSNLGSFSGAISGNLTGINVLTTKDQNINLKIALGFSQAGQPLLAFIDATNQGILDLASALWNDQNFHEFRIQKNLEAGYVSTYFDDNLISQISFTEFAEVELGEFENPSLSVHLFDATLLNSELFHQNYLPNILDLDLITFSGLETSGLSSLESHDVLIQTDSKVEFEFNLDQQDGYIDSDGYDGYSELIAVDEIFLVSDRLRYLVDSGMGSADRRFSIFKDGKGFLNFRICDDSLTKGKQAGIYNLATNIKDFQAGDLHHIGASWKLNTIQERDEMHLFIDGQEVPNIFKFGGKVPVKINSKFRDVSKEVLYDFMVSDIDFCQKYTDGTISAGSAIFQSAQANFSQTDIGRSIIITDSTLAPTLIGGEYIIKSVIDSNQITLGSGSEFDLITFQVSTNDLEFSFPPTAGITSNVLTDLRNSKLSIFRKTPDGEIAEISGIFYTVSNGEIDIVRGENVSNSKFRANLDTRVIEFVGQNESCQYLATVDPTDIEIHIETYGLNLEFYKQNLKLASSSYMPEESIFSGQSAVKTLGTEPADLDDVEITRILLENTIIDINDPILIPDLGYQVNFEIILDNEKLYHNLTSQPGLVYQQNLGRLISLFFDSDNLNYCNFDGYGDGYLEDYPNTITVYGETTDGSNQESFQIIKNGEHSGEKYFTSLERIAGNIIVVDPNYFEAGMISLQESHPISVADNNGSSAEVFEYRNGTLILTTTGSSGTFPFELHPGAYRLEYPTYLKINLPRIGERIYLGSDYQGQNQFGGVVDEFRIISELSSDTRTTEDETAGTRSITQDYYRSIPFCPDTQTLALMHFDNPISLQRRRLRNTEFLDSENNIKYKLNTKQQEALLSVVNDETKFINKMLNFGFGLEESQKVFIEVHKAEGGPLFNDAEFYRNVVEFPKSDTSVNDRFEKSGNFTNGKGLILQNNDGKFRRGEGTIEFWVSPVLDTFVDRELKYYIDIYSAKRERITSTSSTVIELPNAAKEILNVKLLRKTQEFAEFYQSSEESTIVFDELSRSIISGRLEGGTGTDKDFGIGAQLSADGNKIFLAESLPGQNIDVMVTYLPISSQGDRFSIFKNQHNQIVFAITADGVDNVVSIDVDWKKNTWHRVKCLYKTGTLFDTMRIFVDGQEGGFIRYGTGLLYGEGYVYGQYIQGEGQFRSAEYNIPLNDEFKIIAIGSDIFGDYNARSRMDNIRFSKITRGIIRDASGQSIDLDYSENLNTVAPVIEDDVTTLLLDFDTDGDKIDKFATIIDPENGIYNFDLIVHDDFDRVIDVNNGEIEDLIVNLVNRLKPAHTNALVKFKKNQC